MGPVLSILPAYLSKDRRLPFSVGRCHGERQTANVTVNGERQTSSNKGILVPVDSLSFLDHTGDIGFEVRAPSIEELFRRAAQGLYGILVERPPATGDATEEIDLRETEPDLLLRAFLARRCIIAAFDDLRVGDGRLQARGAAAAFDPKTHGLRTELKAVTYHRLEVRQDGPGWFARVIFDV